MMRVLYNLALCGLFSLVMGSAFAGQCVNFDQSMRYNPEIKKSEIYQKLQTIYEQTYCVSKPTSEILIPKTIHQIWLGPLEIPKHYLKYGEKWRKLHPGWEYKLWRDDDIKSWAFASKDLFDRASSYQEKSDILRYEILSKYGGLYVDMDYMPLKSFDDLHHMARFYVGIEPNLSYNNKITLLNGLIASEPDNPMFLTALNKIRQHWNMVEDGFREEAKSMSNPKNFIHLAVNRTMLPFNEAVFANISADKKQIAFPPTYLSIEKRYKILDPIKKIIDGDNVRLYFRTIQPETMATHDRGEKRNITNLTDISINYPWYRKLYDRIFN